MEVKVPIRKCPPPDLFQQVYCCPCSHTHTHTHARARVISVRRDYHRI